MSVPQDFMELTMASLANAEPEATAAMGAELHALTSSTKPVASWAAMAAIQECREACGGHGYLKCARLGDLRNDNDPATTYEGDNNVIVQQTSNWLVNLWNSPDKNVCKSKTICRLKTSFIPGLRSRSRRHSARPTS